MNFRILSIAVLAVGALLAAPVKHFTLQQVLSGPFPSDLSAAPKGGAVAWVLNEHGARNIWVAEGPDYKGRRLTSYRDDDGQEIAQITWTPDGRSIVFVRGGDFETLGDNPNPASLPQGVSQDIWMMALSGGAPRKIAEGSDPVVSSAGDRIIFLRKNEIWSVGFEDGAKPAQLIHAKGQASELRLSPDGAMLAFVTTRTDHAFIAVYNFAAKTLQYLDPSVDRDSNAVWSPDSKQVAFLRIASTGRLYGPVRTATTPWSIRVADAASGKGRELWQASAGMGSAFHAMEADNQLLWGAGDRIVFPWERTGYMHLYSVSTRGGAVTPLNAEGEYEIEHVSLSSDGKTVLFSSNQNDIDRRHLWRVSVQGGGLSALTPGEALEWSPVETSDGKGLAMLRSDSRVTARAAIQMGGGAVRDLAPDSIPADFPASSLVVPRQVIISAADGMSIHCQLFLPPDLAPGQKRAAMIFFHGGPRRQMLLGWHYRDYYHNSYAMNQYLANQGYIVLSVNYRSGIGYGLNFREALNYGAAGASDFNDVLGAGLYMRSRADVDPKRIGLWGGSYGGYLTALGLSRASDLFAVGVDLHGVHDWRAVRSFDPVADPAGTRVAFESSPMSTVGTWRSPVLLIQGDDDRNVPFHETVSLAQALRKQGVSFEQLIFPDEIHAFLTEKRWLEAYGAIDEYLGRHLK